MPVPALWALLPAAANIASTVMTRPRRGEFQPQTDYLERYVNDLRGRVRRGDARQAALQPMLRSIGRQTRQTRREVGQTIARGGLEGTGVAGALRLQAGQQATQAAEQVGERAAAFQQQQTNQLQRAIDRGQLQIGQLEAQGQQQFQQAQQQYRQQLGGAIAQGVGSVASTAMQQFEQQQQALNAAKAAGVVDLQMTPQEFRNEMDTAGINDPVSYVRYLGNQAEQTQQQQLEQQLQQAGGELGLTPQQQEILNTLPFEQRREIVGEQLEQQIAAPQEVEERINEIQRTYSPIAQQQVFERTGLSQEFNTLADAIRANAVDSDILESSIRTAEQGLERQRKVERAAQEAGVEQAQQQVLFDYIEENPNATVAELTQVGTQEAKLPFERANIFATQVARSRDQGAPPEFYERLQGVEKASQAVALGRQFNLSSEESIDAFSDIRRLTDRNMTPREEYEWFNERVFDRYSDWTGEQVEATPADIYRLGQSFEFISEDAVKQAIRTYAENPEAAEQFIEQQFGQANQDDPLGILD